LQRIVALVAALVATVLAMPALAADAKAEIQLGLCGEVPAIEKALGLRSRGAPVEVWLFDDDALVLFEQGVRLRLRHGDARSELTLKVADQDCARVAPALLPKDQGKCEYDLHGEKLAGAVSLSQRLGGHGTVAANDLIAGRTPVDKALSAAQIRYLREAKKLWPLPSDLRALGPIRLAVYETRDKDYDVDVTRLPGGQEYIEISTKVPMADVPKARAKLGEHLARAGVTACADQSAQAVNKLRALLKQ
jgi:hypothetical protein